MKKKNLMVESCNDEMRPKLSLGYTFRQNAHTETMLA